MSPRFDTTVLLWGDAWWTGERAAPLPFADFTHAAEVLAAHFTSAAKPVRLRLIFQPDQLRTVAVNCPRSDRSIVASALAGEYPALLDEAFAWGHEPVLLGTECSTLLHFEERPLLFGLVEQLAARNIDVAEAWPLATFLHGLPSEWTEPGALTVLAVRESRALAYRHGADGTRIAQQWQGPDATGDAALWLRDLLVRNPAEPVALVVAEESLDAGFVFDGATCVERCRLQETLQATVTIPPQHPAQLLPRRPGNWLNVVALAASIALLASAAFLAGLQFMQHRENLAALARHEREKVTLRAELQHLQENAREIAQLRGADAEASRRLGASGALRRLAGSIPSDVALTSILIERGTLTVRGFTVPGTMPTTWAQWLSTLAPAVRLSAPAAPDNTGAFTLTGEIAG
jgi:Tfp pilus assembly protein PilN